MLSYGVDYHSTDLCTNICEDDDTPSPVLTISGLILDDPEELDHPLWDIGTTSLPIKEVIHCTFASLS